MSEPKISFMSPFVFTLICMAMMGGLIGLVAGVANGSGPLGLISGALFFACRSCEYSRVNNLSLIHI